MILEPATKQTPSRHIRSIDFSVLSGKETLEISRAQVVKGDLYHGQRDPVIGGPLDRRLGVGSKSTVCLTCGLNLQHCVGHFGHARLHLPIYHIGFFKHLVTVLKMVCKRCCRTLLPQAELEQTRRRMLAVQADYVTRQALFKRVYKEASKNKVCPHCDYQNPGIKKIPKVAAKIQVKNSHIKLDILEARAKAGLAKGNQKVTGDLIYEMNPLDAKRILTAIPRDEWIILNVGGTTSIEDLIINDLVIPPMCIRPSVMLTNSLSNQDDLSIKIKEIVELNKKIQETMLGKGDDFEKILKHWYVMQSHWSQYINNDTPGLPKFDLKSQQIRSLCTRLKGKQGRFRQNLSGKRSNFTARTVISPDPLLHPSEVRVPEYMARILTIQEEVNVHSLQMLKECVQRGSQKRNGANFIITKAGDRLVVGTVKAKIQLQVGDKVERHLRDGDVVIFNRQPSLHRISMMGFRAKISDDKTLRFNECVCAPFNADFDGDEMNIHVPQTLEARSETLHLMGVNENIITPKSGEPIIALMQDFLTTAFLITDRDIFFNRQQFNQVMGWITDADEPVDLPPPTILKPVTLWTGKQVISSLLRPNRRTRVLVNLATKETIYSGNQYLCPRDGYVLFKNGELLLGRLGKKTLGGNKTGLIYALLRDNNNSVASQVMHRFSKLSSRWLSNFGMTIGISDVMPSSNLYGINRNEIVKAYKAYEDFQESFQKGLLEAKPGMSKEETLESNLNQTLSKVRETVGDNCIANLSRFNKPLIMALCGSKGNAVNLSQMIGCVGQQTVGGKRIAYGFTERALPHFGRLIATPQARGFVKNSFYSGLRATEFFFHAMGGRQGIIDTAVKTADTGYMQRRLIKLIEDIGVMYDYTVRTCDRREIIQFRYGDDGLDPMRTQDSKNPINLTALETKVKNLLPKHPTQHSYLLPAEIIQLIQTKIHQIVNKKLIVGLETTFQTKLLDRLQTYFNEKAEKLTADRKRMQQVSSSQCREYLANCMHGITKSQLSLFFELYIKGMNRCIVEPGQAIGALTAQSIGQPATQMTLKTFHFAGISSMNITQGVPRVNEIINNTKNIATPIITIHLTAESKEFAVAVKNSVQRIALSAVLSEIRQVYDPVECYLELVFNLKIMAAMGLKIGTSDLTTKIISSFKNKVKSAAVINTRTIRVIPICKANVMFELKALRRKLSDLIISGIDTIGRALISKDNHGRHVLYAEGLGLRRVLQLGGVETAKTFSNHISEIEEVFGIQAARQSIINQITETMREHGVNVNSRHINLLSEVMTCRGRIIGFTRNGVDKMKDSTIMLASFQKTTDFLFDAGIQGKHDRLRGVSEKIIMGQPISVGTGMFDIKQAISSKKIYG